MKSTLGPGGPEVGGVASSAWFRIRRAAKAALRGWMAAAALVLAYFLLLALADWQALAAQWREHPLDALALPAFALVHAAWIGLFGAAFALGWHLFGPWMLLPLGGAAAGAVLGAIAVGVVLSIAYGQGAGPRGGVHGGGDAMALVALGLYGLGAALGAAAGCAAGLIVAVVWSRSRRRLKSEIQAGCGDPRGAVA